MELILIYFVFSVVVGAVASGRGRSGFGWFLLALIISPIISIIIVLILPSALPGDIQRQQVQAEPQKRCPYCAELINAQAIKCRHCGSSIALGGEAQGETDPAYAIPPAYSPAMPPPKQSSNFAAELGKSLVPFGILAAIILVIALLR